jgi:PPM family protein phosphatase
MNLEISSLSRKGGRETNEDACGFVTSIHGACVVVTDGAGGHQGGAVAADIISRTILEAPLTDSRFNLQRILELVELAESSLESAKLCNLDLKDMSTTVALALFNTDHSQMVWGQMGDTRIYLFRRGRSHLLTIDHSLVQNMVDAGLLSAQEIRTHPYRNVLYAALGMEREDDVQLRTGSLQLEDGDVLFFCSDGFWEPIQEIDMEQSLLHAQNPHEWLLMLEQQLVAKNKPNSDNYTALTAWIGSPAEITVTRSKLEEGNIWSGIDLKKEIYTNQAMTVPQ